MKLVDSNFCAIFSVLAAAVAADANDTLVRTTEALSPAEEQQGFKLPPGFEITLFASEPMINKPINLAYDDRGRIWVSSTVEYPYAAKKERWSDPQGSSVRDSRDAIKILEDTDGDGRADKVTDFADGLNIPTGVLPWGDGCIAWSIPNIWYFADTTGDGKCDHREVLFGPLGYEKDTHGMCSSFRAGRDGWIYATHGFNNTSVLKAKDGTEIQLNSGNVFRFRPDASTVEIWSAGQVNPFGLCFDRRGNLYSSDCHSAPVYQLLQGAVYPSFGKPHDGLGFGPTMIQHTHGSTGICGIAYVDRGRWGADWNDHLLIGNPVTSRINHDRIEFLGSTPVAVEQPDFLVSEDPWFRPVDLCQGDDGALYVADFYNRIIGHYEVPLDHPGRDRERGRIWRITKTGQAATLAPLESIEPFENPVAALSDPSPFVKRRAANQLQNSPIVQALNPLLQALAETPAEDTHLRHALRIAIREQLKLPDGFTGVDPVHAAEVATIAPGVLTADSAAWLAGQLGKIQIDPAVLTHIFREGAPETLGHAVEQVRATPDTTTSGQLRAIDAIQQGLDERGMAEPLPELLAWAEVLAVRLLDGQGKTESRTLTALPHPEFGPGDSPWNLETRRCQDGEEASVLSSLRKGEPNAEQRTGLVRSKEFPAPAKLTFWICGHRGSPSAAAHDLNYVNLTDADGGEILRAYPPRNDACQQVTWEIPDDRQGKPVRLQIVDGDRGGSYAWLGVTRFAPAVVDLEEFSSGEQSGEALGRLAQMLKLSAPVALRDRLKPWLPAPSVAVQPVPVSPEQRAQLDDLIKRRLDGFAGAKPDFAKGADVFQRNCAVCHQINREGGLVGPQLDGIGTRGVERLSEDILDPNRNIDAHFYLTQFKLKDGSGMSGFVLFERGELLQVKDLTGEIQRVAKSQIESRETLPLSLMPPTFGQSIPEEEFQQLLAWLLKQKS